MSHTFHLPPDFRSRSVTEPEVSDVLPVIVTFVVALLPVVKVSPIE